MTETLLIRLTLRVSDRRPTMNIDRATAALANMKRNATAKRASGSLQPDCCAAGVESEACPNCQGRKVVRCDRIIPGLYKDCERCNGTGRVAKRQPQHNRY